MADFEFRNAPVMPFDRSVAKPQPRWKSITRSDTRAAGLPIGLAETVVEPVEFLGEAPV